MSDTQETPTTENKEQKPGSRIAAQKSGVRIDTGSGAYIAGDVHSGGGTFVGRDSLNIGDIGGGAQANVVSGRSPQDMDRLFDPLMKVLLAASLPDPITATLRVEALKSEVSKGPKADDVSMARLLDPLAEMSPTMAQALTTLFASPALSSVGGPVTRFVLERIRERTEAKA
jgi:hypothetical protein